MKEHLLTVENVASKLGITSRTLHYYEQINLIQPATRTEGGHRLYDAAVVNKLEHILHLKEYLGASLQEIRFILEAEDSLGQLRDLFEQETSELEKTKIVRESMILLESQVKLIDEKIEALTKMRDGFMKRLDKCKSYEQENATFSKNDNDLENPK
ncbi:MerR family transcriptional regulator [Desulfosporosinus sp. PR]|uniref:helix-turn-helix domain-containing protein n=1 Tax=Candidatus Desulfosporosinus nitrosoreducens TaxID=3401928 RepID=UPI0027ED65B0|nr:MerR family transcriptional regulator [Desulfosporosinus sp. PR]MDQ7095657.1 MerR family transcriptional regulator [Desulfosporosinus sp. PR]